MIPDLIERTVWEESGWTVAQHTGSGPHPFDESRAVIIHYTGASTTAESFDGVLSLIRSTQRYYATSRGYSIGYNWCVDRAGRIWELRGEAFKCAANGNSTTNIDPAILCLVNGADPANPAMIAAVRTVVAHCEHLAGRELVVKGHQDVNATGCPGDGLYAQVLDGTFRPVPQSPPPDPTPPPEDDMLAPIYLVRPPHAYRGRGAFLVQGPHFRYALPADVEWCKAEGHAEVEADETQYVLIYQSVIGYEPVKA